MSLTFGADSVAKLEEHDELDLIGSSRSSTTLVGDGAPTVEHNNFTIKLRARPTPNALKGGESIQTTGKRVRTVSLSAIENEGNSGPKRQKMQDKKAVGSLFFLLSCQAEGASDGEQNTIVIHARKFQIESARRKWLYHHHDLFQPLLPSTSFFDGVRKEIREIGGKFAYAPFRAITVQPSLVEGGEMKDYQVRTSASQSYDTRIILGFSFKDWRSLTTCIRMVCFLAQDAYQELTLRAGMNCILGDGTSTVLCFLCLPS